MEYPSARERQNHKRPEEPLGRREHQRLCGRLLCYRDARDFIAERVTNYDHRKRAVTALYRATGGVRWLSPRKVLAIINSTEQAPQSALRLEVRLECVQLNPEEAQQ